MDDLARPSGAGWWACGCADMTADAGIISSSSQNVSWSNDSQEVSISCSSVPTLVLGGLSWTTSGTRDIHAHLPVTTNIKLGGPAQTSTLSRHAFVSPLSRDTCRMILVASERDGVSHFLGASRWDSFIGGIA